MFGDYYCRAACIIICGCEPENAVLRDESNKEVAMLLLVVKTVWMNLLLMFPFIACSLTVYCADGLRSSRRYEVASGPRATSWKSKKKKLNNQKGKKNPTKIFVQNLEISSDRQNSLKKIKLEMKMFDFDDTLSYRPQFLENMPFCA